MSRTISIELCLVLQVEWTGFFAFHFFEEKKKKVLMNGFCGGFKS